MWLTPQENIKSRSGFIWLNDVRKCSVSQVKVSLEVKGLPVTWAAEDAYFNMLMSLKLGRVNPGSRRRPLMPKSERPKPSISGMSTVP